MMKEELTGKPGHQYWHHAGMRRQSQCQYWCAGKHKNFQGGFSTLEMLIAFAVITLSITAVILVSFGNQSVTIDTELAAAALYVAEGELENARADTIVDFAIVDDSFTLALPGELFDKKIEVSYISPCSKVVTSEVFWERGLRNLSAALTSVFTSQEISENLGDDCDTEPLTSDWDTPDTFDSIDLSPSGNKGTDVDVIKRGGNAYAILTSRASSPSKDDFWVINAVDPENITIEGSVDVVEHLNAVNAIENYAFVASASTTGQLQVIDINNLSNPVRVDGATRQLLGVDPGGSYPEGRSIYYFDEKVYVGTNETAGPEFHVFDVSDPENPIHEGSVELTHNVHDIMVLGDYAYIASSGNGCELIVINISNPSLMINPCPAPPIPPNATVFDAPGNADGTALYILGSTVYLGRERTVSGDEFFILNVSDLANITTIGSQNISLKPNTEIVGLIIKEPLAFIVTTDSTAGFQVWNIFDPADIQLASNCGVYNYSEKATGFDFVDNLGFVANESNDALRVIYDTSDICIL